MSEAKSSLNDFSYQPEKVKAGAVFHYTKSNIDGSYPARIFIYIPDNPDWQDFKSRLVSQSHMNSRQCADFIAEKVKKLKAT